MAVLTKTGTFIKIASGSQIVTGVGFQPKAIMFWTTGSGAPGTWLPHAFTSLGFTTGPTNSYSTSIAIQNALAASNSGRAYAPKALNFVAFDGLSIYTQADLASMDVDGFTLTWTGSAIRTPEVEIHYMAIGGSDITNAKVVPWTAPTAAGAKAVTGVGFKPDLVLHNTTGHADAAASAMSQHALFGFGAMNAQGQQGFNAFSDQDNMAPTVAWRAQQTDACIGRVWAGSLDIQAHFKSMDADGFTTHFSAAAGAAHNIFSLCLQGVSSRIGAFNKPIAAAPAEYKIEHLGFTPTAMITSSTGQGTQDLATTNSSWSFGVTDTVNHRASALTNSDAAATTDVDTVNFSDAFLVTHSGLGVTGSKGTSITFNHDEATIGLSTNDSVASEILYVAIGNFGTVSFPKTVSASTFLTPNSTAANNQRKTDICQNGNLLAVTADTVAGEFWLSTTDGLSWVNLGSMFIAGWQNGSIFIDKEDYLHAVWKQTGTGGGRVDGYIYYMRGVPNADRTSWAMSAAVTVRSSVDYNFPDLVAFRDPVPANGSWVHILTSYAVATPANAVVHHRANISTSDVIGAFTNTDLAPAGAGHAINAHTYPSIDFHHTGDGKTVKDGLPHVFTAWSAGANGAGLGIRFRKGTFASGTWSWNNAVEISSAHSIQDAIGDYWLNCLFDGNQVIIGGHLRSTNYDLCLWERDVADVTTTTQFVRNYNLPAPGQTANFGWWWVGSMTYDNNKNVYFLGHPEGGSTSFSLRMVKWTRSSLSLGAPVFLDTPRQRSYPSFRRGAWDEKLSWIYTSGNNSPYSVKYDRIVLTFIGRLLRKVLTPNSRVAEIFKARGII